MSKNLSDYKIESLPFPKLFSQILRKYDYTAFALAEKSGVDRTIIVKMQKGTRALSIENFAKIISVTHLTSRDEELLRQAFIEYSFGADRYKTFLTLISSASKTIYPCGGNSSIQVSLKFNDSVLKLDSKNDVTNTLKSVIDSEFVDENTTGRIFTNMDLFTMFDFLKSHPKAEGQNKRLITSTFLRLNRTTGQTRKYCSRH